MSCTYYYLALNWISFLIWKVRMIDYRISKIPFPSKILTILYARLYTLIECYSLDPSCWPWSFFDYCWSLFRCGVRLESKKLESKEKIFGGNIASSCFYFIYLYHGNKRELKIALFERWDRIVFCFCATINNHLKVRSESLELSIHLWGNDVLFWSSNRC